MALPTLSLKFSEGRAFDVLASDPLRGGSFRRRQTTDLIQRSFEIRWPLLSRSELTDLETEFDTAKGAAGQVTLTHPEDGALTCRFEEDSLRVRRVSTAKFSAAIRVALEPVGTSV